MNKQLTTETMTVTKLKERKIELKNIVDTCDYREARTLNAYHDLIEVNNKINIIRLENLIEKNGAKRNAVRSNREFDKYQRYVDKYVEELDKIIFFNSKSIF